MVGWCYYLRRLKTELLRAEFIKFLGFKLQSKWIKTFKIKANVQRSIFFLFSTFRKSFFQIFSKVSRSQIFFSTLNSNCCDVFHLRNLQEWVKKHSLTKHCSDLSLFEQIVLKYFSSIAAVKIGKKKSVFNHLLTNDWTKSERFTWFLT